MRDVVFTDDADAAGGGLVPSPLPCTAGAGGSELRMIDFASPAGKGGCSPDPAGFQQGGTFPCSWVGAIRGGEESLIKTPLPVPVEINRSSRGAGQEDGEHTPVTKAGGRAMPGWRPESPRPSRLTHTCACGPVWWGVAVLVPSPAQVPSWVGQWRIVGVGGAGEAPLRGTSIPGGTIVPP